MKKTVLLVGEYFPPEINSAADLLSSLSVELTSSYGEVLVLAPRPTLDSFTQVASFECVDVLSVRVPDKKRGSNLYRVFVEAITPLILLAGFIVSKTRRSKFKKFDAIVWYSPTIFFGVFVFVIKKRFAAKSFLVLRDIFPAWAVDLGLIKSGSIIHRLLRVVELFQYSQADSIGVQSATTVTDFERDNPRCIGRVSLLENWSAPIVFNRTSSGSSVTLAKGLSQRKVLLYAGNMGVAQNLGCLIQAIEAFSDQLYLLCVGDGNDLDNLKKLVVDLQLSNVGFHPPVIPSRLPEYFSIADIGVVSLNVSHNTHNIPGKFITYMHYGLPAFVVCNANNDLVDIVEQHDVGWVVSSVSEKHIAAGLLRALGDVGANSKLSSNCLGLASSRFSAKNAGQIIANALGV